MPHASQQKKKKKPNPLIKTGNSGWYIAYMMRTTLSLKLCTALESMTLKPHCLTLLQTTPVNSGISLVKRKKNGIANIN